MDIDLLTTREVDLIFRYSPGRTLRLVKAGKIPFVLLPDGEYRIDSKVVELIIAGKMQGATHE